MSQIKKIIGKGLLATIVALGVFASEWGISQHSQIHFVDVIQKQVISVHLGDIIRVQVRTPLSGQVSLVPQLDVIKVVDEIEKSMSSDGIREYVYYLKVVASPRTIRQIMFLESPNRVAAVRPLEHSFYIEVMEQ